jgi:cytochrome c oxidase cbb3-type subunit 2
MDRYRVIFVGAVLTAVFAFFVLAWIPQRQLSRVVPMDRLQRYSESQAAGRRVYVSLGCVYCHSQQVRDASFGSDFQRGWGRASFPEDYRYDRPHQLGTMRTGPDLTNIALRQPSRAWHYAHLYQPRAVVPGSLMPSFRFLFEERDRLEAGDELVELPPGAAREGRVVVATPDARHLVDYLLSLNRDYPRGDARSAPPGGAGGAH